MPRSTKANEDGDDADRSVVERERNELREFVNELSPEDLKSGGWFTKLLAHSLDTYTDKVDWHYFQSKYEGLPADAIVDRRIQMAAKYAAIEGGISATVYTGAVAATIGSLGGASPITVPAAVATLTVDVAYTTQLQLRLAYDISVLYRVPLDTSDPDDLWKLIRIAFTIKSGEVVREGVLKTVPVMVRPLLKRYYSRSVLGAAKALPVVGRYLLQRNVIKFGIPLVGVPLSVVVNRLTTLVGGRHARAVFRNEARIIEIAERLTKQTLHPKLLLWVAWLVTMADDKISDEEAILLRHLVRLIRENHQVIDHELARLISIDSAEVWRRLEAEQGDLHDLVEAAVQVAAVDGPASKREQAVTAEWP